MAFIKYVLRIPLRMSEEELLEGSGMVHGEAAYVIESCEAHAQLLARDYIRRSEVGPSPSESGTTGVIIGKDPLVAKGNGVSSQEIKID